MKGNETKILKGILANPNKSDTKISKTLRISQPTISRTRQRLEKKGIIESYQVIPNLAKLGFEILAFSKLTLDENENLAKDSRVIYAVPILEGTLVISTHESYTAFMAFVTEYGIVDSEVTTTYAEAVKPLSFQDLEI